MSLSTYNTVVKKMKDGVFDVEIGHYPEDIPLEDLFEPEDVREFAEKIEYGYLDYFVGYVKYFYKGIECGSSYVGGFVYENAEDAILEDGLGGCLEEMMHEAYEEATAFVVGLRAQINIDFA